VKTLVLVLLFHVLGQVLAIALSLPLPGTVLGMIGLLLWLLLAESDEAAHRHERHAAPVLKHLGLFFIPASVGLMAHLQRFAQEGLPLAITLVASALACVIVSALCLRRLAP
jgi:holin-like protein